MSDRKLNDEEARLWRRATRDVARPFRRSGGVEASDAESSRLRAPARVAGNAPPRDAPQSRRPGALRPPSAFGAGDPKRDLAVARRRQPIDRTIDLHGMTRAVAERAFRTFVRGAHRDGCRRLLVITGKGGPASQANLTRRRLRADGMDSDARIDDAIGGDLRPVGRGVLREAVREWVDGPELRPLVARLAPARPKDGGAGAYYLFLKPSSSRTSGAAIRR